MGITDIYAKDRDWTRFAMKICKDPSIAGDLVNEMYVRIHNHSKSKNVSVYRSSFIYTTITNIYKNELKRSKPLYIGTSNDMEWVESQTSDITNTRFEVNDTLNKLSFVERELLMHICEGNTIKSISDCSGVHRATITKVRDKAIENFKINYRCQKEK